MVLTKANSACQRGWKYHLIQTEDLCFNFIKVKRCKAFIQWAQSIYPQAFMSLTIQTTHVSPKALRGDIWQSSALQG